LDGYRIAEGWKHAFAVDIVAGSGNVSARDFAAIIRFFALGIKGLDLAFFIYKQHGL